MNDRNPMVASFGSGMVFVHWVSPINSRAAGESDDHDYSNGVSARIQIWQYATHSH